MRTGPRVSVFPTDQKRVLVVYKKSAYQTHVKERQSADFRKLLRDNDESVERIKQAHDAHEETLRETRRALERLGVWSLFRYRGDQTMVRGVDLVLTIGGDGTLLWAARFCGPTVPMLAINSAPDDSVGHYCGFKKGEVEFAVREALAGKLKATVMQRMQVAVDGNVFTKRILNDTLFCHASPGATSRYILISPDGRAVREDQKSSGIWVGPPAGSTAAQRSAGGKILPIAASTLQYVVREPYVGPAGRYRFTKGTFARGKALTLISKMRDARLYLDGYRHARDVKMGQRVEFQVSDEPLTVLAYRRKK